MAAALTHSAPAPSDRRSEGRAGSRRIFPPQFKLQVLEAYRRDAQCRGNQRATARKFGIHRRQIQKWLQAEPALRAALLRRAPQPAPSPPPYAAGSPESARQPTPPPPPPSVLPTPMQVVTPIATSIPLPPSSSEPIDLSLRRFPSPPAPTYGPPVPTYAPPVPTYAPPVTSYASSVTSYASPVSSNASPVPEPPKKPFKLFRPYLLEDEEEKRPAVASLPVANGIHVSAFVPVQSAALSACSAPRWCAPAFAAPLR